MRFFGLLITAILMASGAQAQVTITEIQPLVFGTMITDPAGSTVTLRPNGQITATGATDLQGGDTVGIFRFDGPRNTSISYSFSTNNILTGNGETVTLNNIDGNRPNPFNIPGSGFREMDLGGDLVIPASTNGGSFSGSFVLTVDNP